jgi:uncharacterized protein (TIRG00374 family)
MKIGWRGALGIALGIALLVYTLRDVHLAEVWAVLRTSNPLLFLVAVVSGTLIFPLRARRWQTILEPIAPGIPLGPLWRAVAVGMFVTNVVPARAGEFARAYALSREEARVPFSAGFASIAVDRVFDALVILAMLFIAMWDPAFGQESRVFGRSIGEIAAFGAVGAATGLALLYAVVVAPDKWERLFRMASRRLSPRLEESGVRALRAFTNGLAVLRHPGRFAAVVGWTAAHWLLHSFSYWIAFRAVGIDVPFTAAFLVQGLITISVALPAAPGFFGLFEAAGVAALALYGVDASLAVSWALGYHLLTFVPITVIGFWYFARLGLQMGDIRERSVKPAGAG